MSTGGVVEPAARLELLRRLTDVDSRWLVWKSVEAATAGPGDVDSAAPADAWPLVIGEFRSWSTAAGFGPTFVCRHAPDQLVLVACVGGDPMRLFQLDVYAYVAAFIPAEAVVGVAELDRRGFRRLRPGAEGLLRLLAAARRPGRPPANRAVLDPIAELLRSDGKGAETAAAALGRAGRPALAAARALAAGSWSHLDVLALDLELFARGVRDPRRRAAWIRHKLSPGARCPLLAALAAGRVVPVEPTEWLAAVGRRHDMS